MDEKAKEALRHKYFGKQSVKEGKEDSERLFKSPEPSRSSHSTHSAFTSPDPIMSKKEATVPESSSSSAVRGASPAPPAAAIVSHSTLSTTPVNTTHHPNPHTTLINLPNEEIVERCPFSVASPSHNSSKQREEVAPLATTTTPVSAEPSPNPSQTVSTHQSEESTWQVPSLRSILLMEQLGTLEKGLVFIFFIVMIYFQCKFSVEDVLAIDWLAVGQAVLISVYDFVIDLVVSIVEMIERSIERVNKVHVLSSVVLGIMASIAFDLDTESTDSYVHKCWIAVVNDAEYIIYAINTVVSFFTGLIVDTIQFFVDLPKIWQYILGITLVTSLIKYGIVHYLISIQPYLLVFFIGNLRYYGPFLFIFFLFRLTMWWRKKMSIRESVIRNVTKRIVDLLSTKTEFYSNLQMEQDLERENGIDLQGYELDSLWEDVKVQVKKHPGIQLNDFYIRGEHIQHWGYTANNPTVPNM